MSERLILKGRIEELKSEKLDLATKAGALIDGLNIKVLPLAVTPLETMDTAGIRVMARELDEVKSEYVEVSAKIRDIEARL